MSAQWVSSANLHRAITFRGWSRFFHGVATLAALQELASWCELRALPVGWVLLCAGVPYLLFRGLANAAVRRFHEERAQGFVTVLLERKRAE